VSKPSKRIVKKLYNWLPGARKGFIAARFLFTVPRMKNSGGKLLITDALAAAPMKLDLAANDREAVLAELVAQIPNLVKQPELRDTLLRALQEREKLHSTGIGDGVALPHARNALVGLVNHSMIVFARHATGVPYGSIDGQPARLFFLLLAPNVTDHLAILARLSRILRDNKTRQALMTAETPAKVAGLIREAETNLLQR
jgi:mannitol/fructose-specific phosphotransferase system IIA component (Ntr-type)